MVNTPKKGSPRKKVQVYKPNPPLDHVLTALFFGEMAFIAKVLYDEEPLASDFLPPLVTFGLYILICISLIYATKRASLVVARYVNTAILKLNLLDKAPVVGNLLLRKWQDQSWQLVIHVSMTACEAYILTYDTPGLFSNTFLAWDPKPFEPYRPSGLLQRFYLFQLAIWTVTCFIHRFQMERIKDYFMMYLHHIVTIGLIVGSYYMRYVRIGLLVLLVHDASDIGVDMLKIFNYMKLRDARSYFMVETVFFLNLVQWIYWRLWFYPFYVIYAVFYGAVVMVYDAKSTFNDAVGHFLSSHIISWPEMPGWGLFTLLLMSLQVLHVIWTALFLRILLRIFMQDAQKAAQVEYEGESDDD